MEVSFLISCANYHANHVFWTLTHSAPHALLMFQAFLKSIFLEHSVYLNALMDTMDINFHFLFHFRIFAFNARCNVLVAIITQLARTALHNTSTFIIIPAIKTVLEANMLRLIVLVKIAQHLAWTALALQLHAQLVIHHPASLTFIILSVFLLVLQVFTQAVVQLALNVQVHALTVSTVLQSAHHA